MDAMLDLIKTVNIYLANKQEQTEAQPHPFLLTRISGYLTKTLSTFGYPLSSNTYTSYCLQHCRLAWRWYGIHIRKRNDV